jgi:UDP-N-acetylglucosamine transferase subunit ALG13
MVTAQIGHSNYKANHYDCFKFCTTDEYDDYIENSSLIICHAGVGTIVKALKSGKRVITVPRLSEFNEHVDDHQLEIVRYFEESGHVIGCENLDDLLPSIYKAKEFVPKKFVSGQSDILKIVENFVRDHFIE